MSYEVEFQEILEAVRSWNGLDVRDLLPAFRILEIIEDNFDEEVDFWGDLHDFKIHLEDEIYKSSVERYWPDGLAGHIDWMAIDPQARYIYRNRHNRANPYYGVSYFDKEEFENEKLFMEARDFRVAYESTEEAAKALGIPTRILEDALETRGFPYADLLRQAIHAVQQAKLLSQQAASTDSQ